MSEEIRNETRRTVTSVGNSWIVCKSKSHPGHVYYFNSLTGEAAWNLSDAEIEKAKLRTKHLGPGAKPTKCPEPKDKPPNISFDNSEPPQTPSSEQFVRISEQQSSVMTFANIANNNATFCTPFNQITGVLQGTQISNPSTMEPVCNFNSLSTYHLNSTPTVYNPKVWAVPQTQQVFIGPGIAPVVNSLGPLNVAYNNLSPNMRQPATGLVFNSFENASQSDIVPSGTRQFYPRDFNHEPGVKRTISKKTGFISKTDLRQKLSFKKRFNKKSSILGGPGLPKANLRNTDIAAHIANNFEGVHSNDLGNELESRSVESQVHETTSRLDLDPIRSLAPSDSNSDAWFIVVDLEVLLHEFKFLTTLTDSDERCHLMVPKRVMEELKNYVTMTENIQAKRILRFLSQHIEIGYAFMAEEPSNVKGSSMAEAIHQTCKELLENQYYLILLTNDNELFATCSSNIKMFRIEEIKNLLKETSNKPVVSLGQKKPFMTDELLNKIKITVPNNTPQKVHTISPERDIKNKDHIDCIPETPLKQNNIPNKTEELIVLKHTVDAGIQTDLEDINASISLANEVEKQHQNVNANASIPQNAKTNASIPQNANENKSIPQNVNENKSIPQNAKEAVPALPVVSNILNKKREIKLNRSISHQPQINPLENERKQFKWRRRRNASFQGQVNKVIQSHNEQNMNTKNVGYLETNTLNEEVSKHPDRMLNNNPSLGNVEHKTADDSVESRESSIYAEPRISSTKENVTIEETSTSVISNTESNYSNSTNSVNQQSVYSGNSSKPMYEVDSITMEQYLRMKCDEWISRFIQIMEEVLSQVLHQEPPFAHPAMPPPWTLHEAAQCVAMKFSGHKNITAAANKLSSILFQVSDAKGKITLNMAPYQYMQMYSYGVHLLAAIMEMTNSCEDIQIAVESLNKLLHDIRNPNMDSSANDTFNDCKHDNMSNNEESAFHSDVPYNTDDSSFHEQEILPNMNKTEEDEKTKNTPKKRKLSEEEVQRPVKFIRNFDIPYPFFKNLSLPKSNAVDTVRSPVQAREDKLLTHSHIGEETNQQNKNTEKGADSDEPINQPNIIRKFSKCPELEEKLKINHNPNSYEDEELDYSEGYGDYLSEDYCSEDEPYEEDHNDETGTQADEEADTNEDTEPDSLKKINSGLREENSKKFKYMMCALLQEIKSGLSQVQILCEQCYKKLKNPDQSTELKCKLRKMAETAHLHTIRLSRSLESMLEHESTDPTQSLSDLLEQADIDIRQVDARLLFQYRIAVENCKKHADEFSRSIKNIISEIKR